MPRVETFPIVAVLESLGDEPVRGGTGINKLGTISGPNTVFRRGILVVSSRDRREVMSVLLCQCQNLGRDIFYMDAQNKVSPAQ